MSLVDIVKTPTAENSAIHLNPTDNVAVARVPLSPGQKLMVSGLEVTVGEPIPMGHKVALVGIQPGEHVRRYGQNIGIATKPIAPGERIHTHNLAFEDHATEFRFPAAERPFPAPPASIPTFLGYPRGDGRVGTRNYIAVVAASNCAAHTAELIAASYSGETLPPNVDGVVAFPHGEGCGHTIGPDTAQLQRTLGGVLNHPNVAGAIILGLGCEVNQIDHYLGEGAPRTDRLVGMTLQGEGGTRAAIESARKAITTIMEGYRRYLRQFEGSNFNDNPSPGNKEGGLSNILEKSLGAMTKAGTSMMADAIDYAERIRTPGFVFMNTPGYDPVSITGLAAGGVNLIAFTTGRGSAIGFPSIPVIKIATNTPMYKRMRDNMDVNAGRIADGEDTVSGVGQEILDLVLRVASGERTCAERLGHKEFVPWRIGPVL
jgi:altronate dehydratase